MTCGKCGHDNGAKAAFCTACGARLTVPGVGTEPASPRAPARGPKPARPAKKPKAVRAGGRGSGLTPRTVAIAGVVAVAMVAAYLAGQRRTTGAATPATAGLAPVALDAGARQVAEKFWCSCGSCDVPELADCTCPAAMEEKRFIAAELERGNSPTDVVRAVQQRYGGMKTEPSGRPQAAATPSPAPSSRVTEMSVAALAPPLPAAPLIGSTAALADTTQVARRFTCACGTCGDMQLTACDCQHPRGATEMKAFIAGKLRQGLSVDDVVQAVAFEYGHLNPEGEERGT